MELTYKIKDIVAAITAEVPTKEMLETDNVWAAVYIEATIK